ncbi:MAG: DUF2079 domain-containing protein [Thermoanaerobaculales bacterium]|jgi:uncharacterized membrane protein|nr:DUF2079 domain-containing protein [Thermoanaerobaculales bacterium]
MSRRRDPGAEPTGRPASESPLRPALAARGAPAIALAAVLCFALGSALMIVVHRPPLAAMIGGALLTTAERSQLLATLLLGAAVSAGMLAAAVRASRRLGPDDLTVARLVAVLWPATLVPVALYAFDTAAWSAAPVLLYAVTCTACAACVVLGELPVGPRRRTTDGRLDRIAPRLALAVAIAGYVGYVSLHTIANHRSLGTAAFDLGIHENLLWNTVHGEVFYSSLMGGHYLGVHTSIIVLLIAPIYALLPATETLLVLQTIALGAAAWPLFLLARRILGSEPQALLVALIWLTHPAVGGANFYDYHPVAFAPVILLTALVFWAEGRWRPFAVAIALLLTVKEEMAIVVVLLGLATLVGGRRRAGLALVAVGALAYVVLQHLVIPHFAGGAHSYAWYYEEMIPAGEGPRGLLTTVLINPIHALRLAATPDRLLFLFQLFAPLAFLTFATGRGWLLTSYGLAATLLASRPPLHQIGFQYALTLLALGFAGALLALERLAPGARRRALTAAAMLAVVTCFHYGMIWPRHHFTGGFHTVDFGYDAAERARYDELCGLVEKIPAGARVVASEDLVPHVARRREVETLRYATGKRHLSFDAALVHNDGSADLARRLPGLAPPRALTVEHSSHFVLILAASPAE